MIEETIYAEELASVTSRFIPTSFGQLHSLTAGMPGQPLILVVHGSGPSNCSDQYAFFLQQYQVRISYLSKFYIVAIDCPGYGKSKGSMITIKTFPRKLFQQILDQLGYKNYFAMLGKSQGGAAIFNAIYQDPILTQCVIMDRPVCGDIQRFRKFALPTLLLYDVEDIGHPIEQGKLLYKELLHVELYTFRNTTNPFWIPDNLWNKILDFFSKIKHRERKIHHQLEGERRSRSSSKIEPTPKAKARKNRSYDHVGEQIKKEIKNIQLLEIEEIQKSELMSVHDPQQIQIDEPEAKIEEVRDLMSPRIYEIQFQHPQPIQTQQLSENNEITQCEPRYQNCEQTMSLNELEQSQKCSICFEKFYRPVVTNCSHTFCCRCLLECLLKDDKCPICRATITKKTEDQQLHKAMIQQMPQSELIKREEQYKMMDKVMKSVVFVQIGNNSRELQTKQSAFTKTKKKYVWQLFVKPPKAFSLEEVSFNINMSNPNAQPIRIRNSPFLFESRGTFSFACRVTIKPKNSEYMEFSTIYRIDIEPGYHSKKVALKKRWCAN